MLSVCQGFSSLGLILCVVSGASVSREDESELFIDRYDQVRAWQESYFVVEVVRI